jgi:hypothetical protein
LGRPHSRFYDTPCVLSRRRALLFCSICAALSRLNALCAPTHSSWSRRCCSPPLLPSPRSPPLFTSGLGTATLRAADRPRQCPARDASGNSASAISLIHPFTTHPAARSDPLPGVVLAASPPPPPSSAALHSGLGLSTLRRRRQTQAKATALPAALLLTTNLQAISLCVLLPGFCAPVRHFCAPLALRASRSLCDIQRATCDISALLSARDRFPSLNNALQST